MKEIWSIEDFLNIDDTEKEYKLMVDLDFEKTTITEPITTNRTLILDCNGKKITNLTLNTYLFSDNLTDLVVKNADIQATLQNRYPLFTSNLYSLVLFNNKININCKISSNGSSTGVLVGNIYAFVDVYKLKLEIKNEETTTGIDMLGLNLAGEINLKKEMGISRFEEIDIKVILKNKGYETGNKEPYGCIASRLTSNYNVVFNYCSCSIILLQNKYNDYSNKNIGVFFSKVDCNVVFNNCISYLEGQVNNVCSFCFTDAENSITFNKCIGTGLLYGSDYYFGFCNTNQTYNNCINLTIINEYFDSFDFLSNNYNNIYYAGNTKNNIGQDLSYSNIDYNLIFLDWERWEQGEPPKIIIHWEEVSPDIPPIPPEILSNTIKVKTEDKLFGVDKMYVKKDNKLYKVEVFVKQNNQLYKFI